MSRNLRAVITGAGGGLGRALAIAVARRGGGVVLADIDEKGAEETRQIIERMGVPGHVVRCDVTKEAEVVALAERARELLGAVDLLANNAGVAAGGRFERITQSDWEWVMNINVWGVIYGCRAFLPAMQERRSGYIINVASAAGLVSAPGVSPYNVTKAAVVALSETLYSENLDRGVRVSVLCPTFFTSKIFDAARFSGMNAARGIGKKLMARSLVQAEDVAEDALAGVLAGKLYVTPMRDGRMLWRAKRLAPQRLQQWLSRRAFPQD